jgi:outer membrane protein TolC
LRKLHRDELLEQAKESLDLAIVGYQTGALTFPDLTDADVNWLRFNLEYQRSITDQNQHFAALERIVGRSLTDFE